MPHLPTLAAEIVFHIGNFPITNSFVNAVLVSTILVIVAAFLGRRLAAVPSGAQSFAEVGVETLLDYMDRVTHSREKSMKFFPIVASLFFFILISNWLGVLPGIGSLNILADEHGELVKLPLLRPANADLNLTVAMAVVAVVSSHVLGVVAIGFWKYSDRFIKLGTLWRSLRKGGVNIFVGIIEFFVGLIEIISEVAKVVSLSLRLFGNIFAGEVLLTVMAGLIALIVPLPFLLLEFLVGFIQATVFAMLTLVYLTMATTDLEATH
ncbi:MAG: F0F1 ATP synthase subunit A [Patescibacteria group bacterium]